MATVGRARTSAPLQMIQRQHSGIARRTARSSMVNRARRCGCGARAGSRRSGARPSRWHGESRESRWRRGAPSKRSPRKASRRRAWSRPQTARPGAHRGARSIDAWRRSIPTRPARRSVMRRRSRQSIGRTSSRRCQKMSSASAAMSRAVTRMRSMRASALSCRCCAPSIGSSVGCSVSFATGGCTSSSASPPRRDTCVSGSASERASAACWSPWNGRRGSRPRSWRRVAAAPCRLSGRSRSRRFLAAVPPTPGSSAPPR